MQAGRYATSVEISFKKSQDAIRCISRYCVGLSAAMIKDITISQARARADAMNYAYRYEEARKEAKDDLRWNRRMQILSLGRDLIAQSVNYAQVAAGLYGSLGQQAVAGASGAAQAAGYWWNRNDTEYPQRQEYQGTGQQPYRAPDMTFNGPSPAPPPETKIYGYNSYGGGGMDGVLLAGNTNAMGAFVDGSVPGNSG